MVPVKKIEIEIDKVYTPKPIRMSHNNIFTFKKAIRTPIEKKKLEDISIEEINNDFKLFKTKSEERLCYEEVLSICLGGDLFACYVRRPAVYVHA
jgi:hypothetical protein